MFELMLESMSNQAARLTAQTVNHIERLIADGADAELLNLNALANTLGYSPFHLHRIFSQIAAQPLHSYIRRRQLTEAARRLVFSPLPLAEIALNSGYTSQQAFSQAFKAMYKLPPAKFRARRQFYPLQLPLAIQQPTEEPTARMLIRPAGPQNIAAWLQLARQSVAGYPHWRQAAYCRHLQRHIARGQACILAGNNGLTGALAFSAESGALDFLAVCPQRRRRGAAKQMLHCLQRDLLPGRPVYTTTFRAGDPADSGQREVLQRLGFQPADLLYEFGYPTQRFVLPNPRRVISHA